MGTAPIMASQFSPVNFPSVILHIRSRLQSPVTRGLLLVASGFLLGKLVSVSKEMVVAAHFGVGLELDSFLLAFGLCMMVANLFSNGISGAMLPMLQQSGTSLEYRKALALEILILCFGLSVLVGLMLYLCAPILVPLLFGSKTDSRSIVEQIHIMVWLIPVNVILQWAGTILARRKKFVLHALVDAFPAMGILALAMAGLLTNSMSLAVGTLLGGLAGAAILLQRSGLHFERAIFSRQHNADILKMMTRFGMQTLGLLVFVFIPIIEQIFSTRMAVGTVSLLGYAQRVVVVVLGMGSLAIGRVAIVYMGEAIQAGDRERFRHLYSRFFRLCMIGGAILFVMGALFSEQLVRLIFERGAFTSNNTQEVAAVLRAYLVQAPFYFHISLLVALAQSFGRQKQVAWTGFFALGCYVLLCMAFSRYGTPWALALALSAMYVIYWGALNVISIPAHWRKHGT